MYHKLCHEFFTRGKESLRKGDLELLVHAIYSNNFSYNFLRAYYYFMKYVLMKLERLPLHPSYKDTTMDKNKARAALSTSSFPCFFAQHNTVWLCSVVQGPNRS